MDPIIIDGTQDTPKIMLDAANKKFEISGKSFPADVAQFYQPVLAWIEDYAENPLDQTVLTLKMDYFNTASSKVILDILYRFEDISNEGHKVKIQWYYPDDDEDMKETGEEYDDIVDVEFEHIEYSVDYE